MEEWILQTDFYEKAMIFCIALAIVLAVIAVVLWIVFDLKETVSYVSVRRKRKRAQHRESTYSGGKKRVSGAETGKTTEGHAASPNAFSGTLPGGTETVSDLQAEGRETSFYVERKILLAYTEGNSR